MRFHTTDTNKTYEVELKIWRADPGRYEPDCLSDLETGVPEIYPIEEGGDAYLVSQDIFDKIVSWWNAEVSCSNEGMDGDALVGLRDEEIERGDEWSLFVRELD